MEPLFTVNLDCAVLADQSGQVFIVALSVVYQLNSVHLLS